MKKSFLTVTLENHNSCMYTFQNIPTIIRILHSQVEHEKKFYNCYLGKP